MKRVILALVFAAMSFAATLSVSAQTKWHDPTKAGYNVIQNQAYGDEIGKSYVRFPARAKDVIPSAVWGLSRHSAGLYISFYTNSPSIEVKYTTTSKSYAMPHMPSTGVSGVDMYRISPDGVWDFCFGGYSFGEEYVSFKYNDLPSKNQYNQNGYEYRVFLPLYNGVKSLQIGVAEDAAFNFIPASTEKPIVLYGTSIAQGGCASRPSMTWGTIMQRSLDYPVINLGFSGNGKMEKEVVSLISEIDARLFILDCIPNVLGFDDIEQRVYNAVKIIREKHSEPILLIEHVGYAHAQTNDKSREKSIKGNEANRRAYEKLIREGVKDIYYLSQQELGVSPESTVDYVHLTDKGMSEQAASVEREVRQILNIPLGDRPTTRPVTQRRSAGYEWRTRHYNIVSQTASKQPKALVIGNSIIHNWGEESINLGTKVWNEKMAKEFVGMGCGWDRIENVLWRVYHGALDGCKPEKIVVKIGTNNIGRDTDIDIVEGIRFLLDAIRVRQPEAKIKVMGILPRRNVEQRVKDINILIKAMAAQEGYEYADPGVKLLLENGKIDESLFTDGVHPNNEGYERIVDDFIK